LIVVTLATMACIHDLQYIISHNSRALEGYCTPKADIDDRMVPGRFSATCL
jgi:hypothetical protein